MGTSLILRLNEESPCVSLTSQVIGGWTEALHRMVQGDDRWEVYVPSVNWVYGELGHVPDIPGHAVLIFTMMEMVAVDCEQRTRRRSNVIWKRASCATHARWITLQSKKTKLWTANKVATELTYTFRQDSYRRHASQRRSQEGVGHSSGIHSQTLFCGGN